MLEFIVLGIVPGTHFNITFSWILAISAVFLIVLEIRYHKNYALKVNEAAALAAQAPKSKTSKKPKAKSTAKKVSSKKKSTTRRAA